MKHIFISFLLLAFTCASSAQEAIDIKGYWELDSVRTNEANRNLIKEPIEWLNGKVFLISDGQILILEETATTKFHYTFEKSETRHFAYLQRIEKEKKDSSKIPIMIEEIGVFEDRMFIRVINICGANEFHFTRLHNPKEPNHQRGSQ